MPETPEFVVDYAPLLANLGTMQAAFLIALGAIVLLGLSVLAITWGFPKLVGFFRKVAK